MDRDELQNRFRHHPPRTPGRVRAHEQARDLCLQLALWINGNTPEGDEQNNAIHRLEEAMFWTNAAIARTPDGT